MLIATDTRDLDGHNILEGVPLTELATIAAHNICPLTEIERRANVVQKNKLFNLSTLKIQWKDGDEYMRLITKLTKAKLMKLLLRSP